MNREIILAKHLIKFEEGFRSEPFYSYNGFPMIGWNHIVGEENSPLPDISITEEEANLNLDSKLSELVDILSQDEATAEVWESLENDDDRKAILLTMLYSTCLEDFLKFSLMLEALKEKQLELATEALFINESVPLFHHKKLKRLAAAMKKGDVVSVYLNR